MFHLETGRHSHFLCRFQSLAWQPLEQYSESTCSDYRIVRVGDLYRRFLVESTFLAFDNNCTFLHHPDSEWPCASHCRHRHIEMHWHPHGCDISPVTMHRQRRRGCVAAAAAPEASPARLLVFSGSKPPTFKWTDPTGSVVRAPPSMMRQEVIVNCALANVARAKDSNSSTGGTLQLSFK
jgi:hypothetical protein